MNDIQMKDAKNMDGMIEPNNRCTMHRMASSSDYSSSDEHISIIIIDGYKWRHLLLRVVMRMMIIYMML